MTTSAHSPGYHTRVNLWGPKAVETAALAIAVTTVAVAAAVQVAAATTTAAVAALLLAPAC